MSENSIRKLFELLKSQIEPDVWWPAESRYEIVIGAVLTQNTSWTNVEKALDNLKNLTKLEPELVIELSSAELKEIIRPCGYYNTKERYLREITAWFIENDDKVKNLDTDTLRKRLLSIHGVGSETADDILLYVYDRPVFIYDLYARRLLEAAGLGSFKTYEKAKKTLDPMVEDAKFTTDELAIFHGLIVDSGKQAKKVGGWEDAYRLLKAKQFPTTT